MATIPATQEVEVSQQASCLPRGAKIFRPYQKIIVNVKELSMCSSGTAFDLDQYTILLKKKVFHLLLLWVFLESLA
jgi:hypothetical protein